MKRTAIMLSALVLIVAACGDDDAATTTSQATSAPATTAAPSTTAAATTAAPTTTAAAETTTTAAAALTGSAAFIDAAADYVGEYIGQWDNATFGSTGAVFFNVVEVNTEAGFVLIEVDADGNAFGASDPDLFVIEISTDGDGLHVGFSEFLGASSFEIDEAGNFTMTAEPPMLGSTLEITGTITGEGFGGTYNIPGLAEGTWSATPTD